MIQILKHKMKSILITFKIQKVIRPCSCKFVILRYAFLIKCTEVILADDNETILEIWAEYDPSKKTKTKFVRSEVSLFERLFLSEKVKILNEYGVSLLKDAKVGDMFQFERLGYFAAYQDSTPEKIVFHHTGFCELIFGVK
ncbi:putative glutamine--tRNA ligase [Lupinus albus]|uniref:Putative glutamine--tRNA ligase n=1 Tax=Lupinus albus TaxID=3870 RepID=A0A6A4NKM2_LUPAL|nr:putative glutamine--tRNA ligase [Lupinus albus]